MNMKLDLPVGAAFPPFSIETNTDIALQKRKSGMIMKSTEKPRKLVFHWNIIWTKTWRILSDLVKCPLDHL